jgi:hypothetical protein
VLQGEGVMSTLIEQLIQYLRDTLNVTLAVRPWNESRGLPFFLQDGYAYFCAELSELNLLLMVDSSDEEHPPATVRKHMDQVREKWEGEVIYVRDRVTAYNRKRLIEHNVPFIVPGNQLYLPMLAIDLREYFRQKRKSTHKFSPATQALVLYWIYNSNKADARATPSEMAKVLGYSKMTMTRAFKEVDAALDAVLASERRNNDAKYSLTGQELWHKLQPFWRSPVKQRYYLFKTDFDHALGLRAGLTAMTSYSMLAEPSHRVFAVSQNEWKVLVQRHEVVVLDRPDSQTVEVEVWGYPPNLFAQNDLVDRLSLYLSLRDTSDERIESALEELLEGMKW